MPLRTWADNIFLMNVRRIGPPFLYGLTIIINSPIPYSLPLLGGGGSGIDKGSFLLRVDFFPGVAVALLEYEDVVDIAVGSEPLFFT